MKHYLMILTFIGLSSSCTAPITESSSTIESNKVQNNTVPTLEQGMHDTLRIVDSSFADTLFKLGSIPLKTLSNLHQAQVTYQVYNNRHVENQVDTTFQITLPKDTFEIHKNASETYLKRALIHSNRLLISQNIVIGMSKIELAKNLNLSPTTLPNFILVEYPNSPNFIVLKFNNNQLSSIIFEGYSD